ncbi:YwgA family protein [Chryseomicrobium sp. FSL W7-1435]|uniref:YwgA family protein n=1 Tax=Chryseomicrobium sp. FSL W7-1435 TaxID=2921704 RepID=UPI003159F0D9
MLRDHASIVRFISQAQGITGRKKLQKMMYIAKKLGYPVNEKYEFHMYGPYSEELTARIEELCTMGFLSEQKEDKGAYTQYAYTTTDESTAFMELSPPLDSAFSTCIEEMKEKSSRFLELVATLFYFDDLEKPAQVEKVHIVKGKLNFTDTEFEEAFAFIEDLKKNNC